MIFLYGYLDLFCLLASILARPSYTPRLSNPSIPGNHLPNFSSPIVSSGPRASNASAFKCHVQPPNNQPQRQPIKAADCNYVITSMLRQADLTDQQSNTAFAGSAHSNTWTFGTCAVVLRTTMDGTASFEMVDILRQVAFLLVSCSDQKTDFLGGTLTLSHTIHPYIEVIYRQVDSCNPNALSRNAVAKLPVRCWDWKASGSSTLNPFEESDCNANILLILADTDVTKNVRSTTIRPFWVRYYDTCMIGLYPEGGCVEHFQYVQALQVAAQVLETCRYPPLTQRGTLGGYRALQHGGCVNAVVSGTGSEIPPHLPQRIDLEEGSAFQISVFGIGSVSKRAVPENISPENALLIEAFPSELSKRISPTGANPPAMMLYTPFNAKCFGDGPKIPSHFRAFFEDDCNTLMQRLVADPTAMIPQDYSTGQATRHWTVGTCRVSFETRPDHQSFSRELYSLYEIVHVARMIIDVCRQFGPPHLGGTRDAREGSAFRIIVWGSRLYGPAKN